MTSDALNQRFLYIPKAALVVSLVLHGAVVVFFGTAKLLDSMGLDIFGKKKPLIDKTLTNQFIQVDMVSLPDQMINEKFDATLPIVDKPATAVEPEPVTKVEDDTVMKTQEAAKAEAELALKKAAKLKAEAEKAAKDKAKKDQATALKKLEEEANREAALKALSGKNGKQGRAKLKGNKLSAGTALTGQIGTPQDRYISLLQTHIGHYFSYFGVKKNITALVRIEVFPNGRLRSKKMIKASPDNLFNSAALSAVDSAQPFPLPEDLSILEAGMVITFTPQK